MLVMVVFFIAFRWIHLSTPLIRLFLLVLILLLMPTLNFLPVWFRSEERFSRNAETDLVCRLLLVKKNNSDTLPKVLVNQIYYTQMAGTAKADKDKAYLADCLQTST